jgi:hypothetical protein
LERKLTAILCADVHGYSRLMGEDEEATHRTLTSYRKLIDSIRDRLFDDLAKAGLKLMHALSQKERWTTASKYKRVIATVSDFGGDASLEGLFPTRNLPTRRIRRRDTDGRLAS